MSNPATPHPSHAPSAPRRSRILLIALLAGFLLAVVITAGSLLHKADQPAAGQPTVPLPPPATVAAPTPPPVEAPPPVVAESPDSAAQLRALPPEAVLAESAEVVRQTEEKAPAPEENKLFRDAKDAGYIPVNPMDKFIGLEIMFGHRMDWKAIMGRISQDVETKGLRDTEYLIPLLMGIRVADGVMAVKARSVQDLNAAADDIKDMATKLRIPEHDLVWANKARAEAARGEWSAVFMSLGFMQKKVLDKLQEAKADQRSLVMLSGWIQGLRYTTAAVLDSYDKPVLKSSMAAHPSYQLRDPKLVGWLIGLTHQLSAEKQNQPEVVTMRKALGQIGDIVNINIDARQGRISREDVEKLAALGDGIVAAIVTQAK